MPRLQSCQGIMPPVTRSVLPLFRVSAFPRFLPYSALVHLLFLRGPAAAGKYTVAKELAALTGFELYHSHLVEDKVLQTHAFGAPGFIAERDRFWREFFTQFPAPGRANIIFTFNPEKHRPADLHRLAVRRARPPRREVHLRRDYRQRGRARAPPGFNPAPAIQEAHRCRTLPTVARPGRLHEPSHTAHRPADRHGHHRIRGGRRADCPAVCPVGRDRRSRLPCLWRAQLQPGRGSAGAEPST